MIQHSVTPTCDLESYQDERGQPELAHYYIYGLGFLYKVIETVTNRVLKKLFSTGRTCKNPNVFEGQLFKTALFQHPARVTQQGMKPGASGKIFTTTVGTYTPIEAQMYLALPPNRGLPGAMFEIDTATLRALGIEPIEGPMRVLPTPNAMGYGIEIIFAEHIPPSALKRIW